MTMTWTASGSCAGTLVFSGKFAEDGSDDIDSSDFVRVQTSVDGAMPMTVLEFRGNDTDFYNGKFAVDTNGDTVGDGAALTLNAKTFSANIPGTMTSSVSLIVTFRTAASNEEIAMDDLDISCVPTITSPPSPPSHPVYAKAPLLLETFDSPAGFTIANATGGVVPFFSDFREEYFGINNGMGASTFSGNAGPGAVPGTDNVAYDAEAYVGFIGAYLEVEGEPPRRQRLRFNPPFTMTWATVNSACAGTLVFSGKFAGGNFREVERSDYIRVQTSVDGAEPEIILEFRGNGDGKRDNVFAVDTFDAWYGSRDGTGDGVELTMNAQTFVADIPGRMTTSVVLSVVIKNTGEDEEIAMDDLAINCRPDPLPPPSSSPFVPDSTGGEASDDGLSAGAIAGIAVGGAICVALALAFSFISVHVCRKMNSELARAKDAHPRVAMDTTPRVKGELPVATPTTIEA